MPRFTFEELRWLREVSTRNLVRFSQAELRRIDCGESVKLSSGVLSQLRKNGIIKRGLGGLVLTSKGKGLLREVSKE